MAFPFLLSVWLKGGLDGADEGEHCSCHLTCCRLLKSLWVVPCSYVMRGTPGSLPSALCRLYLVFSPVDRTRLWLRFRLPALLWRAECCFRFYTVVQKKATSMIICASGFYTVVCDQSSKTPSWYCLLHLLYTKDTNALPALQVQTPTAPPPSGPAQVRCRHFRFQSVAINKSKLSLRYLSQFTRQKKEKEEEKKEAVQCRKPEPQRFNW